MELRHLRYFIAVAEAGSMKLAAESRLHTAQPSLSRQMRDLEQEVGAALFARSVRGVELTPAGRAFLDHARLALTQAEADNFAMAMSLVTSERGVALLPISIEAYLPPSIVSRRLKGEQPTVDLMIGYRKNNASPILKTFLSRIDGLIDRNPRSSAK
jgi:LysR family hca operon transcriptional activator